MTKKTEQNRSQKIIRVSVTGVAANVLLAAFKALAGILAGSVAIVMDAVNNLSDALSSVITIIGTKLSERPADRAHPFGYGRIEYFSAIIISVLVICAGVTSLIESVEEILEPSDPEYTPMTLAVVAVAIAVKLVLGHYVKRQGELLKSDALTASGSDALFDAVITLATLVSAGIMLVWHVSVDGVLGALISLVIIRAGFEMLSSPVSELLGSRISPELVRSIMQEVSSFEGVHGVYDIILHNYGPNMLIGSLHVTVYDTMDAHEIHALTRSITERMLERHGIVLTVGIYAIATGDNRRTRLQNAVLQALSKHREIVQVHGFCYYEKERRVSVDVVPDITVHDDRALAARLAEELKCLVPGEEVTVVIDHNYSE